MILFAEVLAPGLVTATILSDANDVPIENQPMVSLGHSMYSIEFSAVQGRDYALLVDLDGVRYSSVSFKGEADPPTPAELEAAKPAPPPVPEPAPKAPKGIRFAQARRKSPF